MNYTISPIIYKLFMRLSTEEQTNFLKDMLKIEEERIQDETIHNHGITDGSVSNIY
jgi:hypothetical protein